MDRKNQEIDVEEVPDSPRKRKLNHDINSLNFTLGEREKKIRRLQAENNRLKKKVRNLEDILADLRGKRMLEDDVVLTMSSLTLSLQELLKRQGQKSKNQAVTKTYSPALKTFALTLNFYSPRAYNYVRETFDTCLPHQRTLRGWYSAINGEPGFTTEAFVALKQKAESSSKRLLCSLIIDEMAIRKKIEWDGQKYHGFVDGGTGLESDCLEEATQALVFMLVSINDSWKLPVAYFLITGMSGEQKSALVMQCLEKVHETNIDVVSLTFDGCPANFSMAKYLGCDFSDPSNLKCSFRHPITEKDVFVMLDACHMLKLIRNCFEAYGIFIDGSNEYIRWEYLKHLHNLQLQEGLHLGNKLRANHIFFHNSKMKVKLASQLFSNSVADALIFCHDKLKINQFLDVEGTVQFIQIINDLFDILNSRNLRHRSFKKPLCPDNKEEIFDRLETAKQFLLNLKCNDQTSIFKTPRKTGFLGLLICIESVKSLYINLVENGKMLEFLPTYKLSQDHIELFFGNIRMSGWCNNNPTSKQFQATYKKMLVHLELKSSFSGNCIPLQNLTILNTVNPIKKINLTSVHQHRIETEQLNFLEKNKQSVNGDNINIPISAFSEFTKQVVTYIAGFVSSHLLKHIKCEDCLKAVSSKEKPYGLIQIKNRGGLIYPSEDVINICMLCEKYIKIILNGSNKRYLPKYSKIQITNNILEQYINKSIFTSLENHMYDTFATENHLVELIKAVSHKYIDIRIHFITNNIDNSNSKRHVYNKLVLFKGQ